MMELRIFNTVLLLIFITLKLCHQIDWSWLWVASPIWIPLSITLAIFSVVGVLRLFESEEDKNKRKCVEALDAMAERFKN